MTGRARFGEFLDAARLHLDPASAPGGIASAGDDVGEVSRSLLRLVAVMSRYVRDITAAIDNLPAGHRPALNTWVRASIEVREALATSASFLQQSGGGGGRWPGTVPLSPLARRLDGVTMSLGAGRDLLQTHFAEGKNSGREHRSEWSSVIVSPRVTRACLAEIGALGREVARQGADFALSPSARAERTGEARRRLNAACQWLWVMHASAQAAHQHEPASVADRELLHAVPVNALPPRRLPDGGEPVDELCEGVVDCAERVRHGAWSLAEQAAWSPGMSLASLRQVAAASTATSHHCQVLLQALAARTAEFGQDGVAADLSTAADATGRARDRWLRAGQALRRIMTDTSAYVSHAATETGDLAWWTGRLAYADPEWRPAHGPGHPVRLPENLARAPEQVPRVITAVHYACETLAVLALADHEQISTGADVGRILVPTRALPDGFDVPRPFARAPDDRIDSLLGHYHEAGQASREATAAVGKAAAVTRAPSRLLTTARAAIVAAGDGGPAALTDSSGISAKAGVEPDAACGGPGPVQRAVMDLGVTQPELLRYGAEIDQAGEQLILRVAAELGPGRKRPDATVLSRSKGTAALVNHALLSGDPRAVSLLRAPPPATCEPEPEP